MSFVLLLRQLVVALLLLVLLLRRPLVLLSFRLVVASPLGAPPSRCFVVSSCHPLLSRRTSWLSHPCWAALPSSHRASWLLHCLTLRPPLFPSLCRPSSPCQHLAAVNHRCHQTPSNAAAAIKHQKLYLLSTVVTAAVHCHRQTPRDTFVHRRHQTLLPAVATRHHWCQSPSSSRNCLSA